MNSHPLRCFSILGVFLFASHKATNPATPHNANSSVPDCPSGFMTADLSGFSGWKGGCGAIGGLRGTVYAAHPDALVLITAGGLSFLQVMSGKVEVDSGSNARFGYNAPFFSNGSIHLVE